MFETEFLIPQKPDISHELVLRKARIYDILDQDNNQLKVWPLPDLAGISEDEYDNLPVFQPFHPGTYVSGRTVKKDGKEKADLVWCVCTRDFQTGYILGLCSQFYWDDDQKAKASSVRFDKLANYCRERKCWASDFKYEDLVVVKATQNPSSGGLIEFYNRNTGDWFLINTTGAMISVQRSKIYLRVGSPGKSFSSIDMSGNSIDFKTNEVHFSKCQSITLGHSGMLLATIPGGTCIGRNGVMVNNAPNIHV
jgi:hypothetical protein